MLLTQKNTIRLLEAIANKLNGMTTETRSLRIGNIKIEDEERELFLCVNSKDTFHCVGKRKSSWGVEEDAKIKLYSDVDKKLEKFISKIENDNKELADFHKKLNKKLRAINNKLDII